jgi:cytochrome c biogenesis protein CcmG/thiol:disulfide interchange protein DsbE|tara:strand:+ start:17693 stop:18211 length:519 start_codon:yes stop_codon:yes gene_type:complete
MIRKISFIPILVFFAILYFLYGGLGKDPTLIPSPLIGKQVPSFFSETLILEEEISNEGLIGKPYILNVWGSWCYGCSLEHDHLLDIKLKNKIEIYGLNYKDNRNDAKEWLKTKGNPYKKIIFDYDGSIAIDFGVYGAPETFIVDKLGYIIHKHVGPIDQNYYNNVVIPLIEK